MSALPLFLLLLGARAEAGPARKPKDGCALPLDAIQPALALKDSAVDKVELEGARDAAKRSLAQAVRLKGGLSVRFEMGGCAHYNYSFSFRGFPAPKKSDAGAWIKLAFSLLKSVPLNAKGAKDAKLLSGALGAALATNAPLRDGAVTLPCGDAQCELSIRDPKSLVVSYSFPL